MHISLLAWSSDIQEEIEQQLLKPNTSNLISVRHKPEKNSSYGSFSPIDILYVYFKPSRSAMPNKFFEMNIENFAGWWIWEKWKPCSLQARMHLIWIVKNFEYWDILLKGKILYCCLFLFKSFQRWRILRKWEVSWFVHLICSYAIENTLENMIDLRLLVSTYTLIYWLHLLIYL